MEKQHDFKILTISKLSATQRTYMACVDVSEFHRDDIAEMVIIADEFLIESLCIPTYTTPKEAYDAAYAMIYPENFE